MQHDILEFLNASYTPYHAVGNLALQLQEAGFRHLEEASHWELRQVIVDSSYAEVP